MENIRLTVGIVKNLYDLTGQCVGNFINLDTNMETLKRKTEQLKGREKDINEDVNYKVQRSRKRRRADVELWQEDVRRIANDVQTLERQVQEVSWVNVYKRTKLGNCVVETIQEVGKLYENGEFSNCLLLDDPNCGHAIPTAESLAETTSVRNKEKIWNFLMDDAVSKIGVRGMGGVGKTTIMKHINNQLLVETCTFSDVIWVTVSKAFNIKNLQRQIANKLNLGLSDDEDKLRTASEIHNILSQKKRYVLILDDLWKAFRLEEVGIPEPTRDNGCKLVLTTRSLEVSRQMECINVEVERLTEDETLNLFMRNVKEHQTMLDPQVKETAERVAKKCARLPLVIVTVARSMKGVNEIHEWTNAEQIMDKERGIFKWLKFSYSRLKDEQAQHCFLYCALYPEDYHIKTEELIEYWIAEGLIREMGNKEAMFSKGHTILNKLINSCLLENCERKESVWMNYFIPDTEELEWKESVKMHDLIRDMALKITSTSPRFMVRAGEGLKRVPRKGWSEDLQRVSLMQNAIEELPSKPPICPHLTTFLLQRNWTKVLQIPDSFFMHIPRLKVLDLSYTAVESLPNSVSTLENLHQLSLHACHQLKFVPSLEKLKALEHFELTHSQIEEVPQGIEELVNLRKLRLFNSCNLKHVPSLEKLKALEHFELTHSQIEEIPQGIEKLVNLRKLRLSENYILGMSPRRKLCKLKQLHYLRIESTEVKLSAEELLCLKQLKDLGVRFHNVQELIKYVNSVQCKSLERYWLEVGIVDKEKLTCVYDSLRILGTGVDADSKYISSTGVDAVVLPSDIKHLTIERWDNYISLTDIQSLRDARGLRTFYIEECDGLESMFSSSSSSCFSEDYHIPLTTIEKLEFRKLPNFRVLFDRVVPPHNISFNLKRLDLVGCPKMESIFSALLLQNFPNLEQLIVESCENVKEIIVEVETSDRGGHREEDGNTITLPNLVMLALEELPRLKSIYKGIMVCESLQEIRVCKCPMLRRLPIALHTNEDGKQASALPALHFIWGEEEWWESLEWDNPLTKTTLQPFFTWRFPEFKDDDEEEEDEEEEHDEEEEEEEE